MSRSSKQIWQWRSPIEIALHLQDGIHFYLWCRNPITRVQVRGERGASQFYGANNPDRIYEDLYASLREDDSNIFIEKDEDS